MITFHIISLFPDSIKPYTEHSIIKRAVESKKISLRWYNPMDYTHPRTSTSLPQRVDDKPYGGGPGMIIRAEPIIAAVKDAVGRKRKVRYIHFAPNAKHFTNSEAEMIVQESESKTSAIRDVVIICGRYEGIDSRVEDIFPGEVYSIGDYVLTGGEIPALVVIDSVTRRIPGVLGSSESIEEERIAPGKYYTRPQVLTHGKKKFEVPQVLVEGDHAKIEKWRKEHTGDKK